MSASLAPWLQRTLVRALEAHAAARLPHALLLTGPPQLGKRMLAEALAQAVLCEAVDPAGACGACHACLRFAARFQFDPPQTRPDESPAHPLGHAGHPDARFVGFVLNDKSNPKRMYQEIVIDQIRELSSWLVLTPQSRAGKVALIEPAHAMNGAAANALLKTLEEPVDGRYVLLVTDQPHRLPATIRSRCQRIDVALPAWDEARAWLLAQGVDAASADAALAANLGHPGLALRDLREDGLALRGGVAQDLVALANGRERGAAVAQRWGADRPAQRVQFAVEGVRELLAARAAGRGAARLADAGLAAGVDARALTGWSEEANRVRALLRTTLRHDLLLGELLLQWRHACSSPGTRVQPGPARR